VGQEIDYHNGQEIKSKSSARFLVGGKLGLLDHSWIKNNRALRQEISEWQYKKVKGQILAFNQNSIVVHNYRKTKKESYSLLSFYKNNKKQWSVDLDISVKIKALVITRENIFVSGVKQKQEKTEGFLFCLSQRNGTKTGEFNLLAEPVWDGVAVAYGQLFVTTENGWVYCLK
jgi:outer membrane protein assembly factor BamB